MLPLWYLWRMCFTGGLVTSIFCLGGFYCTKAWCFYMVKATGLSFCDIVCSWKIAFNMGQEVASSSSRFSIFGKF